MADQRMMMMMNWDGLDIDDEFFESSDRISSIRFSSIGPINLHCRGSEDEDEFFDINRMSSASAISAPPKEFLHFTSENVAHESDYSSSPPMPVNYDIWMAAPGSIKERRKRLLQGMGLNSNKELLQRVMSKVPSLAKKSKQEPSPSEPSPATSLSPLPFVEFIPNVIFRSRSDGDLSTSAYEDWRMRKEELIGVDPIQGLTRSSSAPSSFCHKNLPLPAVSMKQSRIQTRRQTMNGQRLAMSSSTHHCNGSVSIRDLDTGKEFVVNELSSDGMWNSFDSQTGKQLTMEEFEQSVGHSPIVKELLRRESMIVGETDGAHGKGNANGDVENEKVTGNECLSNKNCKSSKKKTAGPVGWLKNIKVMANSFNGLIGDKDREQQPSLQQQSSKNAPSSPWTKVRQLGKSHKELTGLYMCQEIQAHEGSIWTIKFSNDGRYLASAGEDRTIHVWEVMDFDALVSRSTDEGNTTPDHPMANHSEDQPHLGEVQPMPSEKKKKGKGSSSKRKGSSIPEYIVVPETIFSFSEKPICSLQGHLDDVLDLSWSKSQLLLSSSMDKTVRLWDMESKSCLKLFAHNDYVTCIQFNPIDDTYFISGSLDAKVRIWSIPDRKVVDWTDLNEMVTAARYTPDGQGAWIGSHKGTCRLYNTSESKLDLKDLVSVQNKRKSQAKKITGFEFDTGNPSDVLITSADSRIRVFDGSSVIQKFRGFRNTSSQIPASFAADGKYVVCASEDSQVYIWKRDEVHNVVSWKSKGFVTTQSHEHFQCKEVSVAVPWPGSIKCDPSLLSLRSKRYTDLSERRALPSPSENSTEEITTTTTNTKRSRPPLPKKKNSSLETSENCRCPEEEVVDGSRIDSGTNDNTSFSSTASSSCKFGNSSSISSSSTASSISTRWFEEGNIQNTAWGMVIVTAGLGGEIRTYQNFGLPLRLNRQISLFRDYSLNSGSL